MENLTNLQSLGFCENQIEEIKELDNLTNLKGISFWSNQIEEIKRLEKLTNLQGLNLIHNPIKPEEEYLIARSAQEVVKYCQKKVKKN